MSECGAEPLSDVIDSLCLLWHPEEGALVSDALVLLKVVAADGEPYMSVVASPTMSFAERVGMLRVAEKMEFQSVFSGDEADE